MSILNVKSKKKEAISNFFMRKSLKKIQKSFFLSRDHIEMFISADFEIFVTV